MGAVKSLNASDFGQKVLNADRPVVVDFYATWCPPCRMLAPVLDALAEEYAGQIDFYKVDVDREYSLAERYQISGVPTLVMFQSGAEWDRIVGALGPNALRGRLQRLLAAASRQEAGQPT